MTLKWLREHSFLGALLGGNGKERRLQEAEAEAEAAEQRRLAAVEQAALQTAQLTEDAAILAFGDDSQVDIPAIRAEVDEEFKQKKTKNGTSNGTRLTLLPKVSDPEAA